MRAPNKIELDHSKTKPTKNNDTYSKKYIGGFFREKKHLYHRYGNHLVLPDIFQIFLQWEPF